MSTTKIKLTTSEYVIIIDIENGQLSMSSPWAKRYTTTLLESDVKAYKKLMEMILLLIQKDLE